MGGASVFRDILRQPYDPCHKYKLYRSFKESEEWVQRLGLLKRLPIHSGCVNCVAWSQTGDKLLSGSDDQHLILTNPYNYKKLVDYKTSHRANIFSAKFLPNSGDTSIVSCSGDGIILYTDLLRLEETHKSTFNCHVGTTYEVATIPGEGNVFLSCGEDCTVRAFDLRSKQSCSSPNCTQDVVVRCERAVTALTVNSVSPYQLGVGCSDSTVRLYDRRMLSPAHLCKPVEVFVGPGMEGRSYRITSLSFSPEGQEILVSYSSEHLYIFDLNDSRREEMEEEEGEEGAEDEGEGAEGCSESGGGGGRIGVVRRLRLRGDWSDTGPQARPHHDTTPPGGGVSQARPTLHGTLMQRMTDVLSRMLSDPATRAALSHGGEDTTPPVSEGRRLEEEVEEEGGGGAEAGMGDEDSEGGVESDLGVVQEVFSPELESVDEGEPPDQIPPTEEPPQISQTSEEAEAGPSHTNLTNLKDQLSDMCNGFMQRHGKEPVVNLVYSEKGSTASRICFGDETLPSTSQSDGDREVEAGPVESAIQEDEPRLDIPPCESVTECEEEAVMPSLPQPPSPISQTMIVEDEGTEEEKMDRTTEEGQAKRSTMRRASRYKHKYTGHRNARTMIKEATFWGNEHVVSGSDCGHVFVWSRRSGKVVMVVEADQHVVNCVQPHPTLPILATSGIDYDVKLWAPVHEAPAFDTHQAAELMKRNAVMLEETKDTITVPASFMIRMLACLNQIRRGSLGGRSRLGRRNLNSD